VTPVLAPADLEALYAAHAHGLCRLATLLLGDEGAAQEVVQDAFLALHAGGALRDPAAAPAWLRSAVLNRSRSRLRRLRVARRHVVVLPPGPSAEATAVLHEDQREVVGGAAAAAGPPARGPGPALLGRPARGRRGGSHGRERRLGEDAHVAGPRGPAQPTGGAAVTEDRLRDALRARADLVAPPPPLTGRPSQPRPLLAVAASIVGVLLVVAAVQALPGRERPRLAHLAVPVPRPGPRPRCTSRPGGCCRCSTSTPASHGRCRAGSPSGIAGHEPTGGGRRRPDVLRSFPTGPDRCRAAIDPGRRRARTRPLACSTCGRDHGAGGQPDGRDAAYAVAAGDGSGPPPSAPPDAGAASSPSPPCGPGELRLRDLATGAERTVPVDRPGADGRGTTVTSLAYRAQQLVVVTSTCCLATQAVLLLDPSDPPPTVVEASPAVPQSAFGDCRPTWVAPRTADLFVVEQCPEVHRLSAYRPGTGERTELGAGKVALPSAKRRPGARRARWSHRARRARRHGPPAGPRVPPGVVTAPQASAPTWLAG
jgi:hypothetical protein